MSPADGVVGAGLSSDDAVGAILYSIDGAVGDGVSSAAYIRPNGNGMDGGVRYGKGTGREQPREYLEFEEEGSGPGSHRGW